MPFTRTLWRQRWPVHYSSEEGKTFHLWINIDEHAMMVRFYNVGSGGERNLYGCNHVQQFACIKRSLSGRKERNCEGFIMQGPTNQLVVTKFSWNGKNKTYDDEKLSKMQRLWWKNDAQIVSVSCLRPPRKSISCFSNHQFIGSCMKIFRSIHNCHRYQGTNY